jgi:hypothetical protein
MPPRLFPVFVLELSWINWRARHDSNVRPLDSESNEMLSKSLLILTFGPISPCRGLKGLTVESEPPQKPHYSAN